MEMDLLDLFLWSLYYFNSFFFVCIYIRIVGYWEHTFFDVCFYLLHYTLVGSDTRLIGVVKDMSMLGFVRYWNIRSYLEDFLRNITVDSHAVFCLKTFKKLESFYVAYVMLSVMY